MEIYLINPFQKGYKPKMFNIRTTNPLLYGAIHGIVFLAAAGLPYLYLKFPFLQSMTVGTVITIIVNGLEQWLLNK